MKPATILLFFMLPLAACQRPAVPMCISGTTAVCACPAAMAGVQTCQSDGSFGPCACPTAAFAQPAAPVQPPPVSGVLADVVPNGAAVEGRPATEAGSPALAADAVRAAWIAGPLRGRDNNVARHREARITVRPDGAHELYVRNQFGFRCALRFDSNGRPSVLEQCHSGEAGWSASPSVISMNCTTGQTEEICEGPFRLINAGSLVGPAAFRIVRRLQR